jgi:hypothetical protein
MGVLFAIRLALSTGRKEARVGLLDKLRGMGESRSVRGHDMSGCVVTD